MTNITKLVLNGFKSFAKRTEIVFDNNFNIVLGPNGSGKSNILDALCFVLGRMSSKSMRAERLSHLIYNGGKSKNPASKAEVSIYFDNSKKIFPTQDLTVKITRTVKPSGQSIYKINDERRTRQQVLDLMSAAKINPEGYNVILQGDIVKFVEMSSEERRQIIEEIAGISIYEDKKQKAINELEKVETKLREADILLAERKTHLKELKADRDQALKYRGITDTIKQNKATYLHMQLSNKQKQKNAVEQSIAELKREVSKLQEQIAGFKKKADEKRELINKIGEEIEEKGEREPVRLHKEVEQIRVEVATNTNRIKTCDTEIKKIDERIKQLSSDSAETETKIQSLKEKKSELQNTKQSRLKEKEEIEKGIEQFKKEKKVGDIAEIELQVEKVDKEAEEKQAALQALVEQKQNLLREKDRLELQLQGVDEKISKVLEIEKEKKVQLDNLKQKREEFKKFVLELNKLLNEDAELAARLNSTRKKLAETNEELARLKARHIGSKEKVLGNLAVKKILEQKEVQGIYGTVSELGSAKSKYATALEAAAGPRLNSIVVKDDQVAAKCIKYLKEKKLGIATFLPLNKIRAKTTAPEIKKLLDATGVHDLAVKLMSFDPKFKNVFSYVFGDTLVVDNIDTARRLGIGKARMVTLDGDLAEVSGAMLGGFRQKKVAAFKEDELTREIRECESKSGELTNLAKLLEQKRAELEEKIADSKRKKAELEAGIIKAERSLHIESGDLDVSKKNKKELSEQIKTANQKLSQLETSITQQNKALAEIKTSKQKLREKISELKSPALLAELNAFEQKKRELTEAMLAVDNEIKSCVTQINDVYIPEQQRILQITKQLEKEQLEFEKEKKQLKKLIQEQKTSLKEAEEKAAKFYVKYKALFSQKEKLNEELQKIEEKAIRKEERIRTTEVKINNASLKNAEVAAELSALQEEFKQYSDVTLLKNVSEEQLKSEISKSERIMAQMGNVNLKALEVYDEVEKQYKALTSKRETLAAEKNDVLKLIQEVDTKKKDLFMNTFNIITENFKMAFQNLSTKGEAYLMLENEQNPFEGGVRIRVKISSNKFMDIRSLSGGEKTLTALAFIFAIQEYEPASFYILDEVDAALDKRNSEKFAQLLKNYSQKAQYIVISHNDAVVSEASNLYGVSMNEHGTSSLVSLKV
jgi:chromosome segregation protein